MLNKIVQYYIIAEIGINHDGVKSKAIKLIDNTHFNIKFTIIVDKKNTKSTILSITYTII